MSFKEYELVYGFGDIEVGMKIALDICCIGIMEGEVWQMWNLSLKNLLVCLQMQLLVLDLIPYPSIA